MIIDICIVKATRSQKPEPNHCALCAGVAPVARVARKTMATAVSASANASGNQRSNQSERRSPTAASRADGAFSCDIYFEAVLYQLDRLKAAPTCEKQAAHDPTVWPRPPHA